MPRGLNQYQIQMRAEEYRSLRQEINMILKRGYDIYFSSIGLSVGLIGYGITIDSSITKIIIFLSPIFVLFLGFTLILEQVRTLRRNAMYIRVFHEGKHSGIFWESHLYDLRTRRKKMPKKLRKDITVADFLKGFPNIIDILCAICFTLASIQYFPLIRQLLSTKTFLGITAIVVGFAFTLWLIYSCIRRHKQCVLFQGGGKIEKEYLEEWKALKN